jgi:hypothetical protein
MTNGAVAGAAAGGAGAAAAIANAIKASGVLVRMEPREFTSLLSRIEQPLVVTGQFGVFTTKYQYLTSYKGLAFYTKTTMPLPLDSNVELITAKRIWIPG